ncbi:uncharacterized protein LOC143473474 [Brachyhypopomus gauderio]|uniref:uncharacterized protein LOC143473474 n=1 Tax=Brachyhypopomus gauderio TaxID=698409 RepID=UPI00404222CC
MFILVCRYNRVFAYPGDDVTLTSHLSPETSAVSMEIRWFRGIECIYLYKKGQVTVAKAYAGRVSMLTHELEIGNLSLILREVGPGDTGIYGCQVIAEDIKLEKSIHLYMAGTDPLSPERWGLKVAQQDSLDMEESVQTLGMKKSQQLKEKELEACQRDLEMLARQLQEKDRAVQQLGATLQDREQELKEARRRQEEAQEELQGRTRELEVTMEELRRVTRLLQGRLADLESMGAAANEREEHMKNLAGELEMCKQELATLGTKLQEETGRTQKLAVVLQDKERELEEVKMQQEQRADQLLAVNGGRPGEEAVADQRELLNESVALAERHNPKDQLGAIVRWILKKREKRREREEAEVTEMLEKEFLDFFMARKGLLEGEQGKIVASAMKMADLEKALECTETAEDGNELSVQLREAFGRCREAQGKVEQLTKEIDQQRIEVEQRHTHEIQKIREKYEIVSRLEAEMNLLHIILPDVQAYFSRTAAEMRNTPEKCKVVGERESPAHQDGTDRVDEEETEEVLGERAEDGPAEEECATERLVLKEQRAATGQVRGTCAVGTLEHEDPQTQAVPDPDGELDGRALKNGDTDSEGEASEPGRSPEIVNDLAVEIQAVTAEGEGWRDVRLVVEETGQEDMNGEDQTE